MKQLNNATNKEDALRIIKSEKLTGETFVYEYNKFNGHSIYKMSFKNGELLTYLLSKDFKTAKDAFHYLTILRLVQELSFEDLKSLNEEVESAYYKEKAKVADFR